VRIGRRIGRLTLVRQGYKTYGQKRRVRLIVFECVCSCGTKTFVRKDHLKSGATRSCGCLERESRGQSQKTHGEAYRRTAEYRCWGHMINRCLNPRNKAYRLYGGRGIKVCKEWRSYSRFLAVMGRRPSARHTLERIDNNDGYRPGNVKWATMAEQNLNKRTNHYLTIQGVRKTVVEWAKSAGLKPKTLYNRLYAGWLPERAIAKPIHNRR
jgi:hypothetical protein